MKKGVQKLATPFEKFSLLSDIFLLFFIYTVEFYCKQIKKLKIYHTILYKF